MSVDQLEFRRVMGHFATGVTIVTTHDGAGKHRAGSRRTRSRRSRSTRRWCSSASTRTSDSYPMFDASKSFAINILSHEQETLSRRFAKSGGDKFAGIGYRIGITGTPILSDTIAHLECTVRHAFDAGDHTIYVGEAVDIAVAVRGGPAALLPWRLPEPERMRPRALPGGSAARLGPAGTRGLPERRAGSERREAVPRRSAHARPDQRRRLERERVRRPAAHQEGASAPR